MSPNVDLRTHISRSFTNRAARRMMKHQMRDQVFISYSHKDGRWLDRLQVYLAPLERRGSIRRWDDTLIAAGQRWEQEIAEALQRTRVAVLMVSADFLASDFISRVELPRLLGAA